MQEGKVSVIDPTVWQFFKNKKSILIAERNTIQDALAATSQYYGGKWKLSEKVGSYSFDKIKRFKAVIKENLS